MWKLPDKDPRDPDSIAYVLWDHGETLYIFLDFTVVK